MIEKGSPVLRGGGWDIGSLKRCAAVPTFLCACMMALALAVPGLAQEQEPVVNIRNVGAIQCTESLRILREEGNQVEKTAFLQWTGAYATAASRSNSLIDVFPIGDTWELLIMAGLVCAENEDLLFEAALRTALGRLQPFWVRNSADSVTLNDPGGRSIRMFSEAVPVLQEALNGLGAELTVDGVYGNQTGSAVQRFNQARGSQPWMTPDGALLYELTRP